MARQINRNELKSEPLEGRKIYFVRETFLTWLNDEQTSLRGPYMKKPVISPQETIEEFILTKSK